MKEDLPEFTLFSEEIVLEKDCPHEEISLYLDGELSAAEELLLEQHLSECSICKSELNFQKQMLSALNTAFYKKEEIEIPRDFTRVVVANAESKVVGLRRKNEIIWTLIICFSLLVLLAFGIAFQSSFLISNISEIGGRLLAIGGFFTRVIYDISVGFGIILKGLSQKLINPLFIIVFFSSLILILLLISPKIFNRFIRPKTS